MHGPTESQRLLLEEISKNGGLSIKGALEFGKRDDIWFGIGKDVIDVLSRKEELGYIRYNEERGMFIPNQPNNNHTKHT